MLTIHAADSVERVPGDRQPIPDGAVAVAGDRVTAVGPLDELLARYPEARVRRWPGTLGPARVRTGPLPDAPTPRERVHAVLRLGAAGVTAGQLAGDPGLRAAALRTGVAVHERPPHPELAPGVRADLAVFDADGACLATVLAGRLVHRLR